MRRATLLTLLYFLLLPLWGFEFTIVGDHQPYRDNPQQPPVFIQMLQDINSDTSMEMILCTGDVIFGRHKTPEPIVQQQYDIYEEVLNKFNALPIHVTPGNHDIFDRETAKARFLDIHKRESTWYSFEKEGLHFICIDTEEIGMDHCISKKQFHWLKKELKKRTDETVIVFGHEPLFPVSDHVGSSLDACPRTQKKLFRYFRKYGVDYYICGHEHLYSLTRHDGITQIISGGAGAKVRAPEKHGGYFHYLHCQWDGNVLKWEVIPYPGAEQFRRRHFRIEKAGNINFYIEYRWKGEKIPAELTAEYYIDDDKAEKINVKMERKGSIFYFTVPVHPEDKRLYVTYLTPGGKRIAYDDGDPFKVYLR